MPDGIPEYDELKLRIERARRGRIHVVASSSDGGTATGDFRSPISALELDNFILRVTRTRTRAYRSSQMEEAKKLGGALFEHLMAEDVGDLYHGAWRVADSQGRGLRISLSVTEAPELLEIPWELLYDPSEARFLSQSIYTPVVRSLDLKNPSAPRKVTLPLRVLALVSAPEGFPPLTSRLNAGSWMTRSLPWSTAGRSGSSGLIPPLQASSQIGSPIRDELHVIHYIGHGAYDERHRGRHPRAGGRHRRPQQGHGRGARRIPVRREEPPVSRAEFVRGSARFARRPVLRRGIGLAALRDPGGHRDAGRDHRRGGDHCSPTGSTQRSHRGSRSTRRWLSRDARSSQRARTSSSARRCSSCTWRTAGSSTSQGRRRLRRSGAWRRTSIRSPTARRPAARSPGTCVCATPGGSSLSDVTARDKAGETRAGPLTLAAGATEEMHVDAGGRERLRGVRDRGRPGVGRPARERAGEWAG